MISAAIEAMVEFLENSKGLLRSLRETTES
jgi:hypothetical protein